MVVKIGARGDADAGGLGLDAAARRATSWRKVGDIVYVSVDAGRGGGAALTLEQDSGAQASMMAVDNCERRGAGDGGRAGLCAVAVQSRYAGAAAGGVVLQAYVYTAAMEAGMKPTDIVLDAPTSFLHAERAIHAAQLRGGLQGADDADRCVCGVAEYSGAAAGGQGRHQEGDRGRRIGSA